EPRRVASWEYAHLAVADETQLPADRYGRQPLVARDHHRPDARPVRDGDGLSDTGADGIDQPHQPEPREAVPPRLAVRVQRSGREADHTHSFAGHTVVHAPD